MRDLSKREERVEYVKELENSFIDSLKKSGLKISEKASCRIDTSRILLGVDYEGNGYSDFGSAVTIYPEASNIIEDRDMEINFGTSGSFTPNDKGSTWRTIHASEILQNWETVKDLVREYKSKIYELREIEVVD